jgi:hypothetical protein
VKVILQGFSKGIYGYRSSPTTSLVIFRGVKV